MQQKEGELLIVEHNVLHNNLVNLPYLCLRIKYSRTV